jgi:hypothetical protein
VFVGSGRSPLDVYWEITTADQEIPEVLFRNYEVNVGDIEHFIATAGPRGSGLVTDIAAPPPPPQASKWWTESCGTSGTGYDFASCYWGLVSTNGSLDWGGRFDNHVKYSIARDTVDTDREVILYWTADTNQYCGFSYNLTMDEGAIAVSEYLGSANRTWWSTIDGGCSLCYEFGSIFLYDSTQTATCAGFPPP